MENLTGGTPPVRYLPCVVPCKLYFRIDKISLPFLLKVSHLYAKKKTVLYFKIKTDLDGAGKGRERA